MRHQAKRCQDELREHNSYWEARLLSLQTFLQHRVPSIILAKLGFSRHEIAPLKRVIGDYFLSWWLLPLLPKDRPCRRSLRYIGCTWDTDAIEDDPFFKIGAIYEAESFNGRTYFIKGYDRGIGCAYFEIVELNPCETYKVLNLF